MAQDNIKNLYDALKGDYDLGSEQDFRNSLKDANNRRNLYKAIFGSYDLGSEQDFDRSLGYGQSESKQTAGKAAQQVIDEYDRSDKMTNTEREDMADWAAGLRHDVKTSTRQASNKIRYSQELARNPLRINRNNVGTDTNPMQFGENPNVVETGKRYDHESGKFKPVYITETGNEYINRLEADREQNRIDKEKREEEQRKREEEAKMQHDPTLWETVKKSLGAGFMRVGAGLLDTMQSLTSGIYVENPSSPTGYMRTRSYEEALADKNDPMTVATSYMHNKADKLSEEAQPHSGRKGFLDMLWDGEIGGFLQKGIATTGESLPMTLSAFNPYTMTLNAISMAGSNYRENTLANPDIPAWKRAAQAVGSAAIEQAVEKYSDPIFKYVGGGKILRGASKNASEKITNDITGKAAETLAKRIYGRLKGLGKDALGEGAEEIIGNFGNDILGETLDIVDGNEDYGLRAQWKEMKKENPDADLADFSMTKAKEYVESFIGGAMAGAYTSGTAQLSTKALQYSFDKLGGGSVEENEEQSLNPLNVDVAQSYDEGYSEDETTGLQDTKNLYELRQNQMAAMFGVDAGQVDETIGDPVNFIGELQRLGRTDEIQPVIDYVNARAKYDGMIQRVRDDIDGRIEHSINMVNERTHHNTGMIQGTTLKVQDADGNDRKAYVLSGNLVMLPDGTGVDREKSDGNILILHEDTGEMEMVSPEAILNVDEPVDPETEKQTAAEAIRLQYGQQEANRIEGIVPFNPGDTYTVTDENGQQSQIQVVPNKDGLVDNGDGTVNVSSDGGQTVVPMRKEDVQAMVDATNRTRVEQAEMQREAMRTQAQPTQQSGYRLNDEVSLTDENGNEVRGSITADVNEDGRYEVYTESPINGRKVNLFTAEELDRLQANPAENSRHENVAIVNQEAVNNATVDDLMKTDRGYVEGYYNEHPEKVAEALAAPAQATADYINGKLTDRDYLIALNYSTGENSWLDGSATEEEIEREAAMNREKYLPYVSMPQVRQEQPAQQPVQSEQPVQSAIERIPKDEKGQPIYEQADPDTAWDAIVEQTEGDEAMAQNVADSMVADKEAELKKVEKSKPKGGTTIAEKIAAERERKNAVEQAKANLALWQKIAQTSQRRRQAALAEQSRQAEEAARLRREQEEKERAEREEAERIRREALNGVPDIIDDTPQDARARGYRRVNGEKIDRQTPLATRQGKEVQVKFDDKNIPTGHVALIEAGQLQPSHINGRRNPFHFIDEAQPKERNDEASVMSARKIAANIRPEEITSSVTAYTGAPTVNTRGEVIQGNNRSAALREMWAGQPEQAAVYKQYLTEHAADFGLAPEDVEAMQQPVLVNMVDVPDDEAISLGQFVAQDTESGGTERIKPKNIVQKMGDDMKGFAGRLLSSPDEEMTFSELVDRNGMDVLKWMQQKAYITPTQYRSAFDSKDNLTAEAKNDLKGIMYQSIFQGGSTHLEEMFNSLPAKAQKAILATAYRDYDSPNSERMNAELQASINAYYALSQMPDFANAKNYKEARKAAEAWKRQLSFDDVTGESYLPSERYSNFALLLATMYKGQTQVFIQNTLKNIFDLVQGTKEATLFEEPNNTPRTLVEAVNETMNGLSDELLLNENFIYNGQRRNNVLAGGSAAGQQGRQGSTRDDPSGGRTEGGTGIAADNRGTEGGVGQEEVERREAELASRVQVNDDDWQEGNGESPTYKRSIIIDGTHTATQIDEPDENGHYTGSYFEFDNKRFGDIAEIVDYIDNGNTLASKIAQAEAETDQNPTEAQKEAGNYKKGHVRIGQFNITVENPKGSVRRGTDANGNPWETTMQNTYGYIRGTEGVDGDHIDVFLTNDIDGWNGRRVYIVDQYNEDGTFDEHKVMLGFNDEDDARNAYFANYSDDWANKRKIVMTSANLEDFEKWINSSHRKTKPFAEYKSVPAGETKAISPTDRIAEIDEQMADLKKQADEAHKRSDIFEEARLISESNDLYAERRRLVQEMQPSQTEEESNEQPQEQPGQTDNRYTVEQRYHKKKDTYIYAVKFTEQMPREQFLSLKKRVKDFGGYYSSYGKGGFIFETEEAGRKFAEAVLDPSGEKLDDNKPLSLADMQQNSEPVMRQVDVEGLMQAINENGEAKLSDHLIVGRPGLTEKATSRQSNSTTQETEQQPAQEENQYGASNKLVSRERYEELKKRMRQKLGGQMNMGIDPEILAIGTEMAAYHIEAGARKFADYARHMIDDLGDAIRPYLKSFYNGVRDLPEVKEAGYAEEMTPYDEVRTFDTANFDKSQGDAMATAEMVVAEQEAQAGADTAKEQLINQRNKQRRQEDEQRTADTEAVAGQAEAAASKAESDIEAATNEKQVNGTVEEIDRQLDKVNEQLALLGYYEADQVEGDFNEAYGYMRNAEKKAVKDANNLAEPGRYRSILGEAEDVAKQNELKVGNYAPAETATSNAAEASKNTDSGEDLFRDNEDDASAIYEKGVANTFWHRFSEGWYDYLRSVRVLQDALQKAMGRKPDDFENVLLHALHKTSVDKAQWDKLKKNYIDPLSKSLAKTVDGKKMFRDGKLTQDDVEIYLNCKHGLERNDKFAMRDAEQMRDERIKKADDELAKEEREAKSAMDRAIKRADQRLQDGEIDGVKHDQLINDAKEEYDKSIKKAEDTHEKAVKEAENNVTKDYQKNRKRDYSGLTEIFDPEKEGGYTNAELEDLARQYVADMEQTVPKQELDELWDKIHKLNAYSLRKSYESGLVSKHTYENTKDMFDYYVPLRGFEKETANDVYDYITESDIPIEQVMKHAKGRTSRATNLIATMMNMAHSSIVSGNRNLVKQKLLNLALNADNDLLTVGNQWYEDDGMGGWIPVQEPPIRDGMTAKEAREVVEQFEENMKEREKNGEVRRMRKGVSLPVRIVGKRAENEHGVRVKRNGQEYVVWINGNPKAAQAINGILNPETERGWVLDHIHKLNRFVSKNVTSLRPNFLLSNLKRDILSSNMVGFVKYGIKYTRMFDKFVKDNLSIVDVKGAKAGKMRGIYALYHRYNNGTLDLNDKRDRYFKEFMENGGETGYSQMWSIDDYEKQIRRTLNKDTAKEKFRNGWQAVGDAVEFANRGIENVCRFAAYMASRESGMSVLQSIADAKEASVNFNRKGSGAMGNNAARAMFMFLNPAIQGFMQHNKLLMKYPKRMLAIDGGLIALGVIVGLVNSLICGGGDDDDDKETENDYFNINPFVRRNNIVLRVGRHEYAKIDLPQELRPWYGLGEIAYAAMTGHMKHDNVGVELFSQLTQTIPLNPITGNTILDPNESLGVGIIRNLTGATSLGSITDAYLFDKDYAGNKITKASEYNKLDPEWKRAGRGTSSLMIGTTRMLNDLTGGNDYKKGFIDLNPSRLEHVATSMLGGRVEFFKQLWTTGQALVSGDEDERNNMRNYPFVSTSYINTDNSYNRNYRLNNEFDWYQHEFEQARHEYNGLKNDKKNVFEKAEEFDAFIQTPEYKIYRRFKKYDRRLKKQFEKLSDETDDDKRKKISDRITEIKKDAVEEMQRINK